MTAPEQWAVELADRVRECHDSFEASDAIQRAFEERERKLREVLADVLPYVATQTIGCHGNKCREPWCYSCNDEDDARQEAEKGLAALIAARQALKETPDAG